MCREVEIYGIILCQERDRYRNILGRENERYRDIVPLVEVLFNKFFIRNFQLIRKLLVGRNTAHTYLQAHVAL